MAISDLIIKWNMISGVSGAGKGGRGSLNGIIKEYLS